MAVSFLWRLATSFFFFRWGRSLPFSGQVKDSSTVEQLIESITSNTGEQKVRLTCEGARLPFGKTLKELDVRSGFVLKVEIDTANRVTEIRQKAATLPKTAKFNRAFVIEHLCRLAESHLTTPLDLAMLLLGDSNKVYRVASETNRDEILSIFNLEKAESLLRLKDAQLIHPVPKEILKNFASLADAGFDWDNEQYCRLRADFLMIPALVQARCNAKVPLRSSTKGPYKKHCPGSKTPKRRNSDAGDPRRDLQMFHEYDLRTEIQHPVSGIPYVFTGRADWAAGHSGRGVSDSVLVCVEAKKNETIGKAEQQLTAYLAICHHERKQANKSVPSVQGFSTDGQLYKFQILTSEGTLHSSKTYDIVDKRDLEIVYNFVVHQVETAIHLSPTSTPVKGSRTEKEETVKTYAQDKVWGIFDPVPYCSDGEEEEADQPTEDLDSYVLRKRFYSYSKTGMTKS